MDVSWIFVSTLLFISSITAESETGSGRVINLRFKFDTNAGNAGAPELRIRTVSEDDKEAEESAGDISSNNKNEKQKIDDGNFESPYKLRVTSTTNKKHAKRSKHRNGNPSFRNDETKVIKSTTEKKEIDNRAVSDDDSDDNKEQSSKDDDSAVNRNEESSDDDNDNNDDSDGTVKRSTAGLKADEMSADGDSNIHP